MRLTLASLSKTEKIMDHLKDIFAAALSAVQTSNLLARNVSIEENRLSVADKNIELKKPCHVVGFGKGVFGMASELFKIMGDHIEKGILSVPMGSLALHRGAMPQELGAEFDKKFKVYEGAADNEADQKALEAATAIEKLCRGLKEDDVLIVLITGGGSALLPLPREGIFLKDKQDLSRALFHQGVSIYDVNCVRSRLSKLKGGGLARVAYPATVVSLIVSDIIGDPMDKIASGPTHVDFTRKPCNPYEVVSKAQLLGSVSQDILNALNEPVPTKAEMENMKLKFANVHNCIIGSSALACDAARIRAEELGYFSDVLSTTMSEEVTDMAEVYYGATHYLIDIKERHQHMIRFQANTERKLMRNFERMRVSARGAPMCLIFGGEPTVVIKGDGGRGGRNMHLALEVAVLLHEIKGVHFMSCGTDGSDGATGAAGAISPPLTATSIEVAKKHLANMDSYTFFENEAPEYLIVTGHTGTNVMDIHLLIVTGQKVHNK